MAALLVGMSIMAILMGAALPVWNKQAQREREEEYLFRAHQYARAVMKFRQRIANTNPPSVDVLVEQRFLRKKYKDPINGEDFQLVYQTAATTVQPGGPGAATPGGPVLPQPGGGATSGFGGASGFGSLGGAAGAPGTQTAGGGGTATTGTGGTATQNSGAPGMNAGIIGVVSKSKGTSIKIYNGRTRYDQWAVTYQDVKPGKGLPPDLLQAVNAAGGGAGAAGNPFGGAQGAQPGAANPFGGGGGAARPGMPNSFGTPNPFGGANPGMGQPNPFGAPGGVGQPAPQPPGAGSPFSPTYPPPATGGGGTLFGPPKKN
jgi:type II secretory pathway pseudopilin PulG